MKNREVGKGFAWKLSTKAKYTNRAFYDDLKRNDIVNNIIASRAPFSSSFCYFLFVVFLSCFFSGGRKGRVTALLLLNFAFLRMENRKDVPPPHFYSLVSQPGSVPTTMDQPSPPAPSSSSPDTVDEEYSELLGHLPPVDLAFAYGSGVFQQAGYESPTTPGSSLPLDNYSHLPMLDLVFAVKDPLRWHEENLARNANHYSFLRFFGPATIAQIQGKLFLYHNTAERWKVQKNQTAKKTLLHSPCIANKND